MPVLPFGSDAEVVEFAKAFLGEHLDRFNKDIAICLKADAKKRHAYFPGTYNLHSISRFFEWALCRDLEGTLTQGVEALCSQLHGPK